MEKIQIQPLNDIANVKKPDSIEPKDRRYVKDYGLLSFAKYISKNVSSKYSQKLFDSAINLVQMQQKLLQNEQFKKQQKQKVI